MRQASAPKPIARIEKVFLWVDHFNTASPLQSLGALAIRLHRQAAEIDPFGCVAEGPPVFNVYGREP